MKIEGLDRVKAQEELLKHGFTNIIITSDKIKATYNGIVYGIQDKSKTIDQMIESILQKVNR